MPDRPPTAGFLEFAKRELTDRPLFWTVIALVITSQILGTIGFQAAGTGDLAESTYRAMQLFTLECRVFEDGPPWQISVARFLAPLSLALGAGSVIYGIARGLAVSLNLLRVGGWSDHVIVCGAGRKGVLLVERLVAGRHRVVVIEIDGEAPGVHAGRAMRVPVLAGDARHRRTLESAGIARARHCVALCGGDDVNAEVAVMCRELGGTDLPCVIHIDDPELAALLGDRLAPADSSAATGLHFFSIWDRAAWIVFDRFLSRLAPGDGEPAELLVVGRGKVLRSLDRILDANPTRWNWTMLGSGAGQVGDPIDDNPQRTRANVELTPDAVERRLSELRSGDRQPACVVVDCADDELTLAVGLRVGRQLAGGPTAVLLLLHETIGLGALLGQSGAEFANLHVLQVHDIVLHPDLLLVGEVDRLAVAIHSNYVRARLEKGDVDPSEPSLAEWHELPEDRRLSNRRQAGDLWRKLGTTGFDIVAASSSGRSHTFTASETEQLARLEHEQWKQERESLGWRHGPVKDDAKLESPALVLWEELAPDYRELNYAIIRAIPAILTRAGLALRRRRS